MNVEFISTNNLAGYCSFDLQSGNTRNYHALIMAGDQGFHRIKILACLNETVVDSMGTHDISNNIYQNQLVASVKKYLTKTYYLPDPTQEMKVGNIQITRKYIFSEIENELEIVYQVSTPEKITLVIEPLLTCNDLHLLGLKLPLNQILIKNSKLKQSVELTEKYSLEIESSKPALFKVENQLSVSNRHYYPLETERGYAGEEDLLKVLKYTVTIEPGISEFSLKFSVKIKSRSARIFQFVKDNLSTTNNYSILTDISRFKVLYPNCPEDFAEYLVYNGRKFLVNDDTRHSLIAGYHWFGEWSRDTFISFKGIFLGLGRIHEASQVLLDWSKYISLGLLPNTMEGLHYNSIDGILWYIQAVWYYWEHTGDASTIKHLLPKLERVVYSLCRGSKYGIKVNTKGFLVWYDSSKALTWMDAAIEDIPVIDRTGACVEIQALWYSSLQIIEKLANQLNYKLVNLSLFDEIEALLEINVEESFWLENKGYYTDFISNNGDVDQELRPNQLALFSLPFRIPKLKNFDKAISIIERELLTPVGLRTLSLDSEKYKNEYRGDQYNRDNSYHQGAVWPWLLMLYGNARLNSAHLFRQADETVKVKELLAVAWKEISSKQLITVPELFWGEDLNPGGTIAQAWSVAALLELVMNVYKKI